nr:hypothetical protein [Rappaport israeli]
MTTKIDSEMVAQAPKGESLWARAAKRLFANKAAVLSMLLLAFIALMAVFAPYFRPFGLDEVDWSAFQQGPSWKMGIGLERMSMDEIYSCERCMACAFRCWWD